MSGAGSTQVVWTREDAFGNLPADPAYVYPGRNVQVNDLTLQRALEDSRLPDDNESIESVAQQLEGALTLEYDLCHPWMLTDVFASMPETVNELLEWTMGRGQMPTSRWYIGVDTGNNVCEREPMGAITTQLQISINTGSTIRVSQTIVFADEQKNTTLTPGDILGGDESPYVFHGADLIVDGTDWKKLQQGTLDITNSGSLDYGWEEKAIDAIAGDANYTFNISKIVTDTISDNVSLAYGGPAADTPTASGGEAVDLELPMTRGDGDKITITLEGADSDTHSWDNIPPSDEERVQESFEFNVNRVTVEADVSMANPFA